MQYKYFLTAGNLPDPVKAQEHMRRFSKMIQDDGRVRTQLTKLLSTDCTCKRAEECVVSVSGHNLSAEECVVSVSGHNLSAEECVGSVKGHDLSAEECGECQWS